MLPSTPILGALAALTIAALIRPPTVHTLVVCGGKVDCGVVQEEMALAAEAIKSQLGVRIVVDTALEIPADACMPWIGGRLDAWRAWLPRFKRYDMIALALPWQAQCAFDIDDMFGILGIAEELGVVWLRHAPMFYYRAGGPYGMAFNAGVIVHEVGHLLGASHVAEGIMQPVASPWCPTLQYAAISKAQILRHSLMALGARLIPESWVKEE